MEIAKQFRKSVLNFHYEFNLRHLTKIFQSMTSTNVFDFNTPEKIFFLCLHECERVYSDTSPDLKESHHIQQIIQSQAKLFFPDYDISRFYTTEHCAKSDDNLIFCPIFDGANGMRDSTYSRVQSLDALRSIIEKNEIDSTLSSFNFPNLILFDDAVMHVARIARIIESQYGHALLIGSSGVGKNSLAHLACFMCGHHLHQISNSNKYSKVDFKREIRGTPNLFYLPYFTLFFLTFL